MLVLGRHSHLTMTTSNKGFPSLPLCMRKPDDLVQVFDIAIHGSGDFDFGIASLGAFIVGIPQAVLCYAWGSCMGLRPSTLIRHGQRISDYHMSVASMAQRL